MTPTLRSVIFATPTLVSNFVVTLPSLRNVSEGFWKVQVEEIIDNFAHANLSESYDKGAIGLRKTLATAISALIEYPVRGRFGGFFPQIDHSTQAEYDLTSAEDLARGFQDFMNGCVYGTALEDVTKTGAETDSLEDHSQLAKAFHEFVLVNLASFIHFTLVLSPQGQYLLKLIESANKLIPYMLIRQTLKIGNVASMINAMVRIVLAKMSVTGVTNWIGLTKSKDDGMNLLQYIISTVLHWDIRELEGRASKIKREPAQLSQEQLQTLKEYASKSQAEQEKLRQESYDRSIPIVTVILRSSSLPHNLTDLQQSQALEYLSLNLAIRDRREIIKCLCHSYPDQLTAAIRQVVDVYEPNIRSLHNAVNLSESLGDLEAFIHDIIKVAKIQVDRSGEATEVPSVADFVAVNRKHQYSLHKFLHQICKNGPEFVSIYMDWAKKAASRFRPDTTGSTSSGAGTGSNNLTGQLNALFNTLDPVSQQEILPILDQHSRYMDAMQAESLDRLQRLIKSCPQLKNPAAAKLHSQLPSSPTPPSPALGPASASASGRIRTPRPDTGAFSLSRLQQYFKAGDTPKTPPSPSPSGKTGPSPSPSPSNNNKPNPHNDRGPGTFLARWQDLLDQTPLTPCTTTTATARSSDLLPKSSESPPAPTKYNNNNKQSIDNVRLIHEKLGPGFRKILAER
ncbi:hypothetical protein DV738_g5382, partial [Chaetothyriales sp. CBS 135597]